MDLLSTASKALASWQNPMSSGSRKRELRRGDRVESGGMFQDMDGADDERGAQRALEYPHQGVKRRCFSLHEHSDEFPRRAGSDSPSSSLEFGAFSADGKDFIHLQRRHLLKGRDRAASESAIGALIPRSSLARRQRSLSRGDDQPYVSLINVR